MSEVGVPTVVEELCDVLDRVFNLELVTALTLSAELSSVCKLFFSLKVWKGMALTSANARAPSPANRLRLTLRRRRLLLLLAPRRLLRLLAPPSP